MLAPTKRRPMWRWLFVSLALSAAMVAFWLWPWLQQTRMIRSASSMVLPLVVPRMRDIQIDVESARRFGEQAENETRRFDWVIERKQIAPDGVLRQMITVNGAFPGPTIQANVGDRIVVRVRNRLSTHIPHPERERYSTMMHEVHAKDADSHVSLHWHGLLMRGSPDQDGAHGFSSSSIRPGEEYTYDFQLGKQDVGTHWWHSHVGMTRSDGLWGALIVHSKSERDQLARQAGLQYDGEAVVAFGDHYHKPGADQLSWFMSLSSLGFEPTPESSLINGRGVFDCQRAVAPDTACGPVARHAVVNLRAGEKTRLRLINVGAVVNQYVSIDDHILTVIEADGQLIKPIRLKRLPIAPGQRYSVLIEEPVRSGTADGGQEGLFWLRTTMDYDCFNMPNPALLPTTMAVLRYGVKARHSPSTTIGNSGLDLRSRGVGLDELWPAVFRGSAVLPKSQPWPAEPEPEAGVSGEHCSDLHHSFIRPLLHDPAPQFTPQAGDRRVILNARMPKLSKHQLSPMGYINSSTWRAYGQPILQRYTLGNTSLEADPRLVLELPARNRVPHMVEVVVQNLDDGPHPFHLHGHKFWVMETFATRYMQGPYRDKGQWQSYDLDSAAKRDTINVPRRGYAVLRWRADNPGVWAFHCHVLVHMVSGMAMAFVDQPEQLRLTSNKPLR